MEAEKNTSESVKERKSKSMKFESAEQKRNYMLEEPVERLVCRLAVPTILSMLVTSFYNMADTRVSVRTWFREFYFPKIRCR